MNFCLEEKLSRNIKSLAIDMIQHAKSGHPGIALSAANILSALYSNHINFCFEDPMWDNRDRFILSAGHGSALLYACLFLSGYNYSIEDLKDFRKIHSKTPGHPEYNPYLGIEMTTGPLGQGAGAGVGIALAQKLKQERDYYTYILCGDGDLMEGISYESFSLAGNLVLDNLIILYDCNHNTLDSSTNKTFNENVLQRFIAMGFDVFTTENNVKAIDLAIRKAKTNHKPTFIQVKTILGEGSLLEDTNEIHGGVLSEKDYHQLKEKLGILEPFMYDEMIQEQMKKKITERTMKKYQSLCTNDFPIPMNFKVDEKESKTMRDLSSHCLNALAKMVPIYSGSADLSSSCKTYLNDLGDVQKGNFDGKNIFFGVREHAMGAINIGLTISGITLFTSTFLVFSDYMLPSIRLAALMGVSTKYIFTHDTILIGEDGATHEPIEQLPHLRNIPGVTLYRPCNLEELQQSYVEMMKGNGPQILVISKENSVSIQKNTQLSGYNIYGSIESDVVLGASGSEVKYLIALAKYLEKMYNLSVRVVSIPCFKKFFEQSLEAREALLPKDRSFYFELSNGIDLERLVKKGHIFCLNTFGYSGNKNDILEQFSLTTEKMAQKIIAMLGVEKNEK